MASCAGWSSMPSLTAGVGHLEAAGLESLDAGITGPSFLWRYTNPETSGCCRHESAASPAIDRDGSWE